MIVRECERNRHSNKIWDDTISKYEKYLTTDDWHRVNSLKMILRSLKIK